MIARSQKSEEDGERHQNHVILVVSCGQLTTVIYYSHRLDVNLNDTQNYLTFHNFPFRNIFSFIHYSHGLARSDLIFKHKNNSKFLAARPQLSAANYYLWR